MFFSSVLNYLRPEKTKKLVSIVDADLGGMRTFDEGTT